MIENVKFYSMTQDSLQICFLAAEKRVFSKLNRAKKAKISIIQENWAIISPNSLLRLVKLMIMNIGF